VLELCWLQNAPGKFIGHLGNIAMATKPHTICALGFTCLIYILFFRHIPYHGNNANNIALICAPSAIPTLIKLANLLPINCQSMTIKCLFSVKQ
jgi:hypothetical protein